MDIEKITESIGTRLKEIIIGELRDEFKAFRAEVRGELAGYRLAIESMSQRLTNMENDIRDIRNQLIETNKKIDETKDYLIARIDETNQRIDETNQRIDVTNQRIDNLYSEMSDIKADLRKALAEKPIISDMLLRIERLETKVA